MNKSTIKFISIFIIGLIVFGVFKNFFGGVDNEKLKEVIKTNDVFLVDVRTPEEFSQGSAKGAVNIPLDKIQSQLTHFDGKKNIVVFCRSGNRSSKAKQILEKNGFGNVIDGGTWQNVIKFQ